MTHPLIRRGTRTTPARRSPWDFFEDIFPSTDVFDMAFPVSGLPLDVQESEDRYDVKVDVPGVPKEDIEVSMEGKELMICIKHSEEKEEKSADYVQRERRFGSAARAVPLPLAASDQPVDASLKDGVLQISVKKSPSGKSKRIEIH